jgi:hypothetical protein
LGCQGPGCADKVIRCGRQRRRHRRYHHLVCQDPAIHEFYRVLNPSGLLLFAVSPHRYIESRLMMAIFRRLMEIQRTAPEYLAKIKGAWFGVRPEAISYPILCLSRTELGMGRAGLAPRRLEPSKRRRSSSWRSNHSPESRGTLAGCGPVTSFVRVRLRRSVLGGVIT